MGLFIRRCLAGGLLVWLPILATLFVLHFIVSLIDNALSLLPAHYQPQNLFAIHIPGLGIILAVLILFFTGLLASNFFGKKIVRLGEYILNRIPFVRTIYSSVKQVLETVLIPSSQSFRQVLLINFPHKDSWTLGFLAGQGFEEANEIFKQPLLSVFIPTAPNPTSGYMILVPREQTTTLNMSVDEALKFVISLGVVQPKNSLNIKPGVPS